MMLTKVSDSSVAKEFNTDGPATAKLTGPILCQLYSHNGTIKTCKTTD